MDPGGFAEFAQKKYGRERAPEEPAPEEKKDTQRRVMVTLTCPITAVIPIIESSIKTFARSALADTSISGNLWGAEVRFEVEEDKEEIIKTETEYDSDIAALNALLNKVCEDERFKAARDFRQAQPASRDKGSTA